MKNDREFSGTLLGFGDFVSPSFIPRIVSRFPTLSHLEWLANAPLLSRRGPGGRDGIVRCFDRLPPPPRSSLSSLPRLDPRHAIIARLRLRERRRPG